MFGLLVLASLLVRGELFSRSPWVILGQVAALALMVWARTTFHAGQFRVVPAPAGGPLLTRGPYRFIRHPMYAGAMLLVWSSVLGHRSMINAGLALLATAAMLIRVADEERALRAHFPDYPEYARRTKRLIPYIL
jgi:protein-S-isoprenylcysteine O-methyltransferase